MLSLIIYNVYVHKWWKIICPFGHCDNTFELPLNRDQGVLEQLLVQL